MLKEYNGCIYNYNEYEELDDNAYGSIKTQTEINGYNNLLKKKLHLGNFGIIYEIELLGAKGKKVKIMPNLFSVKSSGPKYNKPNKGINLIE